MTPTTACGSESIAASRQCAEELVFQESSYVQPGGVPLPPVVNRDEAVIVESEAQMERKL